MKKANGSSWMTRDQFKRWWPFFLVIVLLPIGLIVKMSQLQDMSMIVLVAVTMFYAISTERQAQASIKMAEEMREQRLAMSRPIIIMRPVHEELPETEGDNIVTIGSGYFSHFSICNVGNGPAIEVEASLLNSEKDYFEAVRETYLRAGEERDFRKSDSSLAERPDANYYLLCEYKDIPSGFSDQKIYQTWLPFKLVKTGQQGKFYVAPGELIYKLDVPTSERIGAFPTTEKPK